MNRATNGLHKAGVKAPCVLGRVFAVRRLASAAACHELLVDTTQVPGVALVTFNRPSRMNALSLDMGEAVKQLSVNLPASTRVVVFTGKSHLRMYVYEHVYVFVCMCMHMYVYAYVCVCICMCIHMYVYAYVCVCIFFLFYFF